ncbi:MAG TPA: LLM class flavin-dependent oxidoreductase [Candidatus Dormibacteraeota bacterium]|jgi:alkanesulfonate monooxygenase SsuD/methylene tetrahydromethanopterin reductase-like flavin-dependent oxidoreductase (luciferase family)|nr:LLM class flavin-dependent oxidoreductase [Candidatus Dormibacteraeota bacterium]
MARLSVGVVLSSPATVAAAEVADFARRVEEAGLDAVFVGDHLTPARPLLDSTVTLATVAAVTRRIRVGFGVMVVALRHPAWVAREVAALQLLSAGRVILGVGTGGDVHGMAAWRAVGVDPHRRGVETDARLALLPDLISGRPTAIGPDAVLTLAPGAEVPPIWVGGGSAVAMRRSVANGATWFPSMLLPADLAAGVEALGATAAGLGRMTPPVAVGGAALLGGHDHAADLERFTSALIDGYGIPPDRAGALPITGGAEQAAERMHAYAEAGASWLVLSLIGPDWRRQSELLARARQLLE